MVQTQEDVQKWEDAICPICLDHPHNAVLLKCSSYDNGCRPFMCNTSSRHSNCLNQFHKSGVLACPLCRGQITGWSVIEAAREFMDSKTRTCSTETCDFSGNYMELRKHARSKHPTVKPSAVDSERQREWVRLERERNHLDLRSMLPRINSNEQEETLIYDEMETEVSYNNNIQGAVAVHGHDHNNGGMMVDGILCFDSIIQRLPSYYRARNDNYIIRQNNTLGVRIPRNNYGNQNLSSRGINIQTRQNTQFNTAAQNNNWRNW
ncbi:hypothetical protein M5689_021518 [Euphorbia peplus]|nr:hypothetical protein M5689_021518 [Euphorbia peplus]